MIDWNQIELKGRVRGTVYTTCPSCSHTRKKKNDPCLSVNLDKGAAKCHHCDDISWRESMEVNAKTYEAPPQQWQNFTNLSDGAVKWFKERCISQNTLISCKITEEMYYQPQKQKKVPNIVFNYFEGDKLLNKKYRTRDKSFTQTKNAKKVFYGINDIVGVEECYIVEGEMDKLAMYEAGVKNCISVPNGANDLNDIFETCERYLKNMTKFYIAVDMDEPGQKLEDELVKRLGKHKCVRVQFKGKDANDDLISNCLDTSLKNIKQYPIEGTFTANDVEEDIFDLYENGFEKPLKPKGEEWRELNQNWSILRGQLQVVTGVPTHGKSNIIEWYTLSLVNDNDLKASFYSPEHLPMQLHHSVLASKVIGKPFMGNERMSKDELRAYNKWSSERIFLTAPESGKPATWDWLLETFEQQIFRYGVDLFVIDAFNKVKRKAPDSLGEISEILARLTLFCQYHNVNVFLIAHPTKMSKNEDGSFKVPTLYDVKGSGDFYDQTHNGATIYRYFEADVTSWITTKLKFNFQGKTHDECRFRYNKLNGRYHVFGDKPNNESLIKTGDKQELLISQEANDWLQTEDEVPF